ncbi:hypothetical protein KEJ23_08340 [Candidatus Bathyarchaeota archaeon]|nr:hypothetical protein [Candidatus Bathyarchaeota archaeon]
MKRLSLSIPDELFKALEKALREEGVKRSHLVAKALSEYLSKRAMYTPATQMEYPTALWKLKFTAGIGLRSPKLVKERVKGGWVVEEY